jgi:hypothetical protein
VKAPLGLNQVLFETDDRCNSVKIIRWNTSCSEILTIVTVTAESTLGQGRVKSNNQLPEFGLGRIFVLNEFGVCLDGGARKLSFLAYHRLTWYICIYTKSYTGKRRGGSIYSQVESLEKASFYTQTSNLGLGGLSLLIQTSNLPLYVLSFSFTFLYFN